MLIDVGPQLWASFVREVLGIIRAALEDLAGQDALCGQADLGELDLNVEFFKALTRATHARQRELRLRPPPSGSSGMLLSTPMPFHDSTNQPSPDEIDHMSRHNKRPDFQWSMCDDYAEANKSRRTFVAECKRLRGPSPSRWTFNVKYVEEGAKRFTINTHLYGRDDIAGVMVGYVQAMELAVIWSEISAQLAMAGLPQLPMPQPYQGSQVVHSSEHELTRTEGQSPFHLHHLWVDLRQ